MLSLKTQNTKLPHEGCTPECKPERIERRISKRRLTAVFTAASLTAAKGASNSSVHRWMRDNDWYARAPGCHVTYKRGRLWPTLGHEGAATTRRWDRPGRGRRTRHDACTRGGYGVGLRDGKQDDGGRRGEQGLLFKGHRGSVLQMKRSYADGWG